MATLHLPEQLSLRIGCKPAIDIDEDTLAALLSSLARTQPRLEEHLFSTSGTLSRYLRIFVDGKLCIGGFDTIQLGRSSQVRLVTALAGG